MGAAGKEEGFPIRFGFAKQLGYLSFLGVCALQAEIYPS